MNTLTAAIEDLFDDNRTVCDIQEDLNAAYRELDHIISSADGVDSCEGFDRAREVQWEIDALQGELAGACVERLRVSQGAGNIGVQLR